MPYTIRKVGKKFAIVNKVTGKIVGRSDTRRKAMGSIAHREDAEKAKKTMKNMRT